MLQRVISIRNVGRFRNCAAVGDVTLRRATLIYAENGRGKTTLCAVLRSLFTNQPDLVLGRTSLGGGGAPEVQLLIGGQNIAFRHGAWVGVYADIAVFDATYVSEDVFAGDVVTTDHRRNLYRVIIGVQGVALANRVNQLDADIRTKNNEIRDVRQGLHLQHGDRVAFEAFQALPIDPEIEGKIEVVEKEQRAAQQIAELLRRPEPRALNTPMFPAAFAEVLAKTLPDISAAAERMVAEHIARHRLGDDGERWLAKGLEHTQSGCPFCGRTLDGIELIAAYRDFFNQAYHRLRNEIEQMRRTIEGALAERSAAAIEQTIVQNANEVEYWKAYCTLDELTMPHAGRIVEIFADARDAALALLERKASAPLDGVAPNERYTRTMQAFEALRADIAAYNAKVAAATAVVHTGRRSASNRESFERTACAASETHAGSRC